MEYSYTWINIGLREGWLQEISLDKAKQFLYGNKKFIELITKLVESNLIKLFWSTKHNDLIVCRVDKLKMGRP